MPFFQTPDAIIEGPTKIDYVCNDDLSFTLNELAVFITIMHRAAYPTPLANDTPPVFTAAGPIYFLEDQPRSTAANPHVSSRVLYTNIFRHFVVPRVGFPTLPTRDANGTVVLITSTPGVLDINTISTTIRTIDPNLVGQYMEGANLFTIWLTRLRFKNILRQIFQLTPDTLANVRNNYNAILNNNIRFFRIMRTLLVQHPVSGAPRLIDPLNDPALNTAPLLVDSLKHFSRILYPDKLPIGFTQEADNIPPTAPQLPASYGIRKQILSYSATTPQQRVKDIISDLYDEGTEFINVMTECIYTALGGFGDCRAFTRAASGDGAQGATGGTQGILDIPNAGVLFFPYEMIIETRGGETFVYPNSTQTTTLPLQGGNARNRVVHIGLYGVDPTDTFTITVSTGMPGSPRMVFKEGTGPERGSFIPRDFAIPANGQVIFFRTNNTPYARFNNNTKDLIIFDNAARLATITLNSGTAEIFMSAGSFCQNTPVVPINLTGAFGDDRFEVNLNDFTNLIVPAIGNAAMNDIITLLLDPNCTITSSLTGGFVGMPDPTPTINNSWIVSDGAYAFTAGPRTGAGHRTLERANDLAGDVALRYSFARITYTNPLDPPQPLPAPQRNLDFFIESYTSPVYSRLDKRFLGPNLDGTGNPATQNFDYRNNDPIPANRTGPNLAALKLHTVFGMAGENIANSDAYIVNTEVSPTDPNYNIPSYNQVLSALRSFGILEAIFCSIVQYTTANQPANAAAVQNRLLAFLHLAHSDPNVPRVNTGFFSGTQKILYYNDNTLIDGYRDFKWYTSVADVSNYNTME